MSLPRSKSAPQSVAASLKTTPLRINASHADLHGNHFGRPPRTPYAASSHMHPRVAASRSPAVATPRADREDPFNLGGFFPTLPATPGVAPREEEECWNWLHREEEITEDREDDDESVLSQNDETPPGTPGLGDEQAMETIRREDKMGVLSLNTLFNRHDVGEDRLFSPYSDEEAVDMESLHISLCARRRAQSLPPKEDAPAVGTLFLQKEVSEDTSGWATYLRKAVGF